MGKEIKGGRINEKLKINGDCYFGNPHIDDGKVSICIDGYLDIEELKSLLSYLEGLK